jgi:hypothetical protein
MTSDYSEFLFISGVFGHSEEILDIIAGTQINLDLSEIGFVKKFDQSVRKISLVTANWSYLFNEDSAEVFANGSEVRIPHDGVHQFVELVQANTIDCPVDCNFPPLDRFKNNRIV